MEKTILKVFCPECDIARFIKGLDNPSSIKEIELRCQICNRKILNKKVD